MRSSLALTATVLSLAWAVPASAQMCGAAPATGSTASAPTSSGMCGMMRPAATDPSTAPSTPPQGQAAGGCPCCRNMAMMQGGMGGMMGGGAQRPPQQPSAPSQSMPGMPGMGETPQTPRPQDHLPIRKLQAQFRSRTFNRRLLGKIGLRYELTVGHRSQGPDLRLLHWLGRTRKGGGFPGQSQRYT